MKLTKSYTPTGKVKIVDENGFSICNMTSNVQKENEANADYIIALNQQRNQLLKALTRLYDSLDSCVELTPEVLHQALTAIKNANQK
jgi:acetolactate synthase regulatory subunit